ncbi:hypothetical protein J7L05_09980 [bacterium]|nr:hypothetical protein [bacterium]
MTPDAFPMPSPSMIFFIAVIAVVFNTFILMWAAGSMDVPDASFGKCFLTVFFTAIVNAIFGIFFKGFIGFVVALLASTTMIKLFLDVEWGRAFMIYIMMLVITIVIAIVLGVVLASCTCLAINAAIG